MTYDCVTPLLDWVLVSFYLNMLRQWLGNNKPVQLYNLLLYWFMINKPMSKPTIGLQLINQYNFSQVKMIGG